MSVNDKYTRRALLGRLGGAAAVGALSPFIPYTQAEAAAAKRPRYCYMFTPVNPKSSLVTPYMPMTSGDITGLNWRGTHTALNTMKDKMSLYGGLTNMARKDGNLGGGHRDSWVSMLVGAAAKNRNENPNATNLGGGSNLGNYSSIDQWLATELPKAGVNTPLRDIRYGWEHAKDGLNSVSFKNGVAQLRDTQPSVIFDKMFQFAGGGAGGGGVDQAYKKNILDYVYGDIKRVQAKLTADDRARVEQNLDAIDEVQRVIAASEGGGSGGSCDIPAALDTDVNRLDLAVNAFTKLTAIAFNCDITRVAGGQYLPYQAGDSYHKVQSQNLATLGNKVGSNWHSLTHDKGNGGQAAIDSFIQAVQQYRCEVYLNLMKELDKFPEPTGGTLLDSSIVHWYIEISADHKVSDQFNLIAGGAGHFQMGKRFIVGGKTGDNAGATQNMLLTSIANAMGFKDVTNFGEAKYHTGPIPSKYLA